MLRQIIVAFLDVPDAAALAVLDDARRLAGDSAAALNRHEKEQIWPTYRQP
jgi:hypothetical protein